VSTPHIRQLWIKAAQYAERTQLCGAFNRSKAFDFIDKVTECVWIQAQIFARLAYVRFISESGPEGRRID
jgi:hypothetical protein